MDAGAPAVREGAVVPTILPDASDTQIAKLFHSLHKETFVWLGRRQGWWKRDGDNWVRLVEGDCLILKMLSVEFYDFLVEHRDDIGEETVFKKTVEKIQNHQPKKRILHELEQLFHVEDGKNWLARQNASLTNWLADHVSVTSNRNDILTQADILRDLKSGWPQYHNYSSSDIKRFIAAYFKMIGVRYEKHHIDSKDASSSNIIHAKGCAIKDDY